MSNSEELIYEFESGNEVLKERYALAVERLGSIEEEHLSDEKYDIYFHFVKDFILMLTETYDFIKNGGFDSVSIEELAELNRKLYEDILPSNYDKSYGNPTFACEEFGDDFGHLLSALYFEVRGLITNVFKNELFELTVTIELFLEVYGAFLSADQNGAKPSYEEIRKIMYWFGSDYAEQFRENGFAEMVVSDKNFVRDIVLEADLTDLRYLYRFGEYITDNELKTAQHLNSLSQEEIDKLATTFTEGYRIGFEITGKDISIKKTASLHYNIGFERMVRKAIDNLEKIGLKSTIQLFPMSIYGMGGSASRGGTYGAIPNKQFNYDHKEDVALFLDNSFVTRKLEAARAAGEKYKKEAKLFGGPAVIEVFGEVPFSPKTNEKAVKLSPAQQKMLSEFRIQNSLIVNDYIINKERSFTIISFPVPDIGEKFNDIFNETVRINTLDYKLYQGIQQKIIDALDEAEYVIVKGMGDNHTKMKVMLHELKDKAHETNFENCVADVNIPVGEVFTSPVLTGTEGTLHVTGVYLEGLFFKNLEIKFKDGCITDYSCSNFDTEEEGKKYISDNILFNHKTLPIGEFAIGTNTTAYVVARKYGIADKLPILIAEKTGPHFAVGDTCYSYEEDTVTYNPDGKSIIARDNEISIKRKTEPDKAYFSCHTDITIPYDELGEIKAVRHDGSSITIIEKGRFVLEGTEELNKPMDE
ncbi:aminopeptidase [Butyrivibrio sp. YAB3001]|uniref:aminopeptidase n=1 Tax=Butyrivibrio sp. YAB3001 TaxID=1520812 RepID=UPI0008F646BB|nr:aminopeptidase [Butyrivibrio sp. YAB3001]SFC41450.1 Leucyl aminopeptidase (aminopeptidase T) [Butyrivibrio sp. YAB3001]